MKQRLTTPWGDLGTWVTAGQGLSVSCTVGPVQPHLLPHMAVDGCLGAVWRLTAEQAVADVLVHAAWSELPKGADGAGDPGERLDAMTWDIGRAVLSLGTEDGDGLAARARRGDGVPEHWSDQLELGAALYTAAGLVVPLPSFRKGDEVSLHFLVAWEHDANSDDPWTWFAVEQSHKLVLAEVERVGAKTARGPSPTSRK